MPFVRIFALEGRTVDQKRELVRAVTRSVCETIAAAPEDALAGAGVVVCGKPSTSG